MIALKLSKKDLETISLVLFEFIDDASHTAGMSKSFQAFIKRCTAAEKKVHKALNGGA
jgi:hypothetical protein